MSASIVPLDEAPRRRRRIALGNFDGLHLGHRAVVAGADTVVTFDPHPLALVAPERAPLALSSLARRAELLAGLGVEELVVIPFDDAVRRLSPDAFVDRVLVGALGVSHVSVGAHFRFGHRGAGDAAHLARDRRFVTRSTPLVRVAGDVVSSTRIRALVARGALDDAAALLGESFVLEACAVGRGGVGVGRVGPGAGVVGPGTGVVGPGAGPVGRAGWLRVPPGRALPGPGAYDALVAVDDGRPRLAVVVLGEAGPADGRLARLLPWRCDGPVGPPVSPAPDGATVRIAFRRRTAVDLVTTPQVAPRVAVGARSA